MEIEVLHNDHRHARKINVARRAPDWVPYFLCQPTTKQDKSAHVMKPGRTSSIIDPIAVNANCDDLRQIAGGYIAYYGMFTVDEASKTVIHHVEVCTLPAWIGSDQKRQDELVGSHQVLRADSGKVVLECLPQ